MKNSYPRTPYQDYVAAERRAVWAWRIFKFVLALVVVLAACGQVGA